ncbi:hypothetical protein JHK85_016587 [Glycine max]|nr:hypothetical protein JHK85_016587 [Glycine max]KAG5046812.1 hypothetical protein JHK86_016218 [Glycine max]
MAKIALPPVSPVAVAKQPRVLVPACFASMHGESRDMIAATIDTLVVTNELAMAEVMKHPHVLHKIKQELDTIVGPNGMVEDLTKVGENLRAKLGLHERRISKHVMLSACVKNFYFRGSTIGVVVLGGPSSIRKPSRNELSHVDHACMQEEDHKGNPSGLSLQINTIRTLILNSQISGPQITIFDSVATLHVAISGPTTTHHVTIFDLIV